MLSSLSKVGTPQARRMGLRALSAATTISSTSSNHHTHHNHQSHHHLDHPNGFSNNLVAFAGLLGLATGAMSVAQLEAAPVSLSSSSPSPSSSEAIPLTNTTDPSKSDFNRPPPRPDLPTFGLDEVAEHCDEESLWYTFRGGVYDMVSQ